MKHRVLVVEDDPTLMRVLTDNLTFEGYHVAAVADGDQAILKTREFLPDLILLDVMLPGKSGFELCEILHQDQQNRKTAFIILTACGQKSDKLRGLNLGADDYITKPFELDELLARIRSVLRRVRPVVEHIRLGEVTVDLVRLTASSGDRTLDFSHREFELLRYLVERHDRVVYRDELLREVWRYMDGVNTRAVDHAIARLRRKLEPDLRHPQFIHTVHGDGYCLTPTDVRHQVS